jgi:hypothetical protein
LAKRLGRPLSCSGVAVINIGGVAFPPFAELFGPEKLPFRCAIISDADPPTGDGDDGSYCGSSRTPSATSKPRPLVVGRTVSALRGGGTVGRQLEAVDRIVAFTAGA